MKRNTIVEIDIPISDSISETKRVTLMRDMPEIKFSKTHKNAILPKRAHEDPETGDTGYDLYTVEDVTIEPQSSIVAPVGLTLAYISPGYWFRIEPKSGHGFKRNLQPHLGIIDNGYRNDLGVKVYNFSKDKAVTIPAGHPIAQFVVYELIVAKLSFTDTIEESVRGDKGFGSTHKTI